MPTHSISVEMTDVATVCRISGDMDLAACGPLGDDVAALIHPGRAIVLDLSGVTFMDSSGIRLLLTLRESAAAAGASLTLSGVRRPVHRVLEITGLTAVLPATDVGSGPTLPAPP